MWEDKSALLSVPRMINLPLLSQTYFYDHFSKNRNMLEFQISVGVFEAL